MELYNRPDWLSPKADWVAYFGQYRGEMGGCAVESEYN
jgi:hypothetical protein